MVGHFYKVPIDSEFPQPVNNRINSTEGRWADVCITAIPLEVQKAAGNIRASAEHSVMSIAAVINEVTEIVRNEQAVPQISVSNCTQSQA
jgi:hypothetical protein